ncbi:hypothetical protein Tco_0860490 [Tanacetum coccineum]|uniref:Uncharacterized protein n=1 Tax=Tanacetum coccineum TaxID=301880 RepID=A0ABQ5BFY6_9ASTR
MTSCDDGNPSSVNIKQHYVTNRFTLIVLSALRHSDNENKQVRSVLTKSKIYMMAVIPYSSRVQLDLNQVVEIPQVIVGEQLVLDMIVDEKPVLYMVDDEQLMLHKFVVVDDVNKIVVIEEMLKTVDYTVVGCTVDCCKMELKFVC